jgi:hypothetical protein
MVDMKIRQLRFSPDAILNFLKSGGTFCLAVFGLPLPPDTKIVECGYDRGVHEYWANILSEEFDEVVAGCRIPVYRPMISRDYEKENYVAPKKEREVEEEAGTDTATDEG